MTHENQESVYQIIRTKCRKRFWTSREFAMKFSNIKFTSRCKEMQEKGEKFRTKIISIRGVKYKGYQYLGKKVA